MTGVLEALGLKWISLAAGFVGALVSLRFIEGLSLWQRATTVFSGALVAAYLTPLTVELLSLSLKMEGAVAFLGGLFGMSLAGAAIKAIPEWMAEAKRKVFGGGA
jgi:hypothetical protein